jgi:hypothetical protein
VLLDSRWLRRRPVLTAVLVKNQVVMEELLAFTAATIFVPAVAVVAMLGFG